MLLNFLNAGSVREALVMFLLTVPSMLIALTFHEVAHGFVAYKCGDPTAKYMGRLTLNPIKHLDPIGSLCMLLTGYGWARPVPVNSRYFKKPRNGMALTALAGPMTNFILGVLGTFIYCVLLRVFYVDILLGESSNLLIAALDFFFYFAWINFTYAIFNMIPLPPFDGSRIFLVFLPPKYYFGIMKYERYIMIGVLCLLAFSDWSPVSIVVNELFSGLYSVFMNLLF